MKTNTPLILLIFLFIFQVGHSYNPINLEKDQFIEVNETVELALIIAAMSDLDRNSNNSINRQSNYYKELEVYFTPFKNHKIFKKLGENFNLPRLAGNAANYCFNNQNELVLTEGSTSIWKDSENDLFQNYLNDINNFAKTSNFREFYKNHKDLYSLHITNTDLIVNQKEMLSWLNNEFQTVAKPLKVFISPLMSGFHWTTLFSAEQRIWINSPSSDLGIKSNELYKLQYARAVFTELDHGYVNPVSDKYSSKIEKAFNNKAFWGHTGSAQGYSSPELKFNEYMTWSVYLLYAQDTVADKELFDELKGQTVVMMQTYRGFTQFEVFFNEALRLNKSDPKLKAEEIQVKLIQWSHDYSSAHN